MESFLANLKARHAAGLIYTYLGEVCVSVNPYKTMDIYGSNYVNQYKVRHNNDVSGLVPQLYDYG
jgi:myosin-1